MKKVRVFFWIDARQKKRLEDLSRSTRVLVSEYLQEAINDVLTRHENSGDDPGEHAAEDSETSIIKPCSRQAYLGGG